MKAVQLLVDSLLPEDVRDPAMRYDAAGIERVLADVARRHPEQFGEVAGKLADAGRQASWTSGTSFRLGDFQSPIDMASYLAQMKAEVADARKTALDDADFQRERQKIWLRWQDKIERDVMDAGRLSGNSLVTSVASGARGKNAQIRAMIATPGLYQDNAGGTVPLFVGRSFSQGLRPAEMLAGSYGARSAVLSTKLMTARGGDLGKQLAQTAADLVVTMKDCGTTNGIDLGIDDPSLRGRVTTDGTVLDKRNLAQLRNDGSKMILARSALTCEAPEGVCAKCLGLQANRQFPKIGYAAGMTSANAVSEPVIQSMGLNVKHTGGQTSSKKEFSGFDYINQFVQAPDDFPDAAAVAKEDGMVEDVRDAPQGGKYIRVGENEHYVLPGFEPTVKPGDKVEAGDALSGGLINPSDIVELRGLGEGRRYYSDRLKKILDDSGVPADARNTEVLARAALRHIRIEDAAEDAPWLPDDLVDYRRVVRDWQVPEDTADTPAEEAAGKWLAAPALHFTVGTKLTPNMTVRLKASGIKQVRTTATDPGFRAEMPRLRTASHVQDDWLAGQHTSYLKGQLLGAAERGADTNIESNSHFAPRLAIGEDFGKNTGLTGKF